MFGCLVAGRLVRMGPGGIRKGAGHPRARSREGEGAPVQEMWGNPPTPQVYFPPQCEGGEWVLWCSFSSALSSFQSFE